MGRVINGLTDRVLKEGMPETNGHEGCACFHGACANTAYSHVTPLAILRKGTARSVVEPLTDEEAYRLGARIWSACSEQTRSHLLACLEEADHEDGCDGGPRCGSMIGCACGYCGGTHDASLEEEVGKRLFELKLERRKRR
jgi:hypothetical protein